MLIKKKKQEKDIGHKATIHVLVGWGNFSKIQLYLLLSNDELFLQFLMMRKTMLLLVEMARKLILQFLVQMRNLTIQVVEMAG